MRRRGGRGRVIEFDRSLIERIEEMKKELGYYPTLRAIGQSFTPPYSHAYVSNCLRRLATAGRLSEGAAEVYGSRTPRIKN
jgi:hypothetical protein